MAAQGGDGESFLGTPVHVGDFEEEPVTRVPTGCLAVDSIIPLPDRPLGGAIARIIPAILSGLDTMVERIEGFTASLRRPRTIFPGLSTPAATGQSLL